MRIAVSAWSYRELFASGAMDYPMFLAEAKRAGADGIEVYPEWLDPADPMGHAQTVADEAEQQGLSVATFITRNDFACRTAAERAEQVERMKRWIVAAAASGVRHLNTFTGNHNDGENPTVEYYRVIDSYREVAPCAEENAVNLCLENMASVCPDADGLLSILRAVDNPNLRTNPDPLNFRHAAAGNPEHVFAETRKLMPWASSFHLHVGQFTAEGEHAGIDTARLVALLREFCYAGHIVLEYGGGSDPSTAVRRGVEMMRKYLG